MLERAVVFKESDFAKLVAEHRQINADLQPVEDAAEEGEVLPDNLDAAIRLHVKNVFDRNDGNISRAASALGITRTTLRKWLQNGHS